MLSQRDDSPLVGFTRPTRIESRGWVLVHNPFFRAIFPLQVDTDVMYLLSPNGSIVRSKARLKKEFEQLGVSESDLRFPLRLSTYTIEIDLKFPLKLSNHTIEIGNFVFNRKLLEFKPDEFKGPDDGKTLEVCKSL